MQRKTCLMLLAAVLACAALLPQASALSRKEKLRRYVASNLDCFTFVADITQNNNWDLSDEKLESMFPKDVVGNGTYVQYLCDNKNSSAEMKPVVKEVCKIYSNYTNTYMSLDYFVEEVSCEAGWDEVGFLVVTYIMAIVIIIFAVIGGIRSSNGSFGAVAGSLLVCSLFILFTGVIMVGAYTQDVQMFGVYLILLSALGIFTTLNRHSKVYYLLFALALGALLAMGGGNYILGPALGGGSWNGLDAGACQADTDTSFSSYPLLPGGWGDAFYEGTVYCNVHGDMLSCGITEEARALRCGDCEYLTAIRVISYLGFWFVAMAVLLAFIGGVAGGSSGGRDDIQMEGK